jgi:hypothetical protein
VLLYDKNGGVSMFKKFLIVLLFVVLFGCQSNEPTKEEPKEVSKKTVEIKNKEAPQKEPTEMSLPKEYSLWLAKEVKSPNVYIDGWGGFIPDDKEYIIGFQYELTGDLEKDKQKMIKYTERITKKVFEQRDEIYVLNVYWNSKPDTLDAPDSERFKLMEVEVTRSDWNDIDWKTGWTGDVHHFWAGKDSWQDIYH